MKKMLIRGVIKGGGDGKKMYNVTPKGKKRNAGAGTPEWETPYERDKGDNFKEKWENGNQKKMQEEGIEIENQRVGVFGMWKEQIWMQKKESNRKLGGGGIGIS